MLKAGTPERAEYRAEAVEKIKQKIRLLNWISLLMIYLILLLIVKFMYQFLSYLPVKSTITMLVVMGGLVLMGFYISRVISANAIRAIEEYSNKLSGLLTTTRDLHGTVHSDVLLKNIMDKSIEMTRADGGSLLLKEGDSLVFKTVRGQGGEKLTGFSVPLSEGIAGWVAENGGLARVDDARQDKRFYPGVDKFTGYDTRSVLCVPLRSNSATVGALELVSGTPYAFGKEDEEIISYLADQAAVSMERAKFYEDEKNYEIHLTSIISNMCDRLAEKVGHSKRIAKYTLLMADSIRMSEAEKRRLYRASLLHDIGFLDIDPSQVATIEEFRSHARMGYDMLKPINFYSEIAKVVLHHHERWDGGGYPDGLKGAAIPLESRMIAVAEAFDAMVNRQSYKRMGRVIHKEYSPDTVGFKGAIGELVANAGGQFDPELVKIFVNIITEDYVE